MARQLSAKGRNYPALVISITLTIFVYPFSCQP